jgi:hypothetical protein
VSVTLFSSHHHLVRGHILVGTHSSKVTWSGTDTF